MGDNNCMEEMEYTENSFKSFVLPGESGGVLKESNNIELRKRRYPRFEAERVLPEGRIIEDDDSWFEEDEQS